MFCQPIIAYRNLRVGSWSIAQAKFKRDGSPASSRGKLIGHRDRVILSEVSPVVSQSAPARIRRTNSREVYAWLSGLHVTEPVKLGALVGRVSINPHKDGEDLAFHMDGKPLAPSDFTARIVVLDETGMHLYEETDSTRIGKN